LRLSAFVISARVRPPRCSASSSEDVETFVERGAR
jgi:hypothetical protein